MNKFKRKNTDKLRNILINAKYLLDIGESLQAKKLYLDALKIKPNDDKLHYLIGSIEFDSSDYSAAANHFSKAITIKSNFIQSRLKLLHALLKLGRFDDAELLADTTVFTKSNNYNLDIGNIFLEENQSRVAIKYYERAIAMDSSSAASFSNRGVAFSKEFRFDEAVESFDQAIAINPLFLDAYLSKAQSLKALNRREDAAQVLEIVVQIDPLKSLKEFIQSVGNSVVEAQLHQDLPFEKLVEELKTRDFTDFVAVLSVSPYYNKPTQEGIYQHFKAIAEASPIPVILYNVPGRTACNMMPSTVIII
jgi:tetratricopeptide (TPR) repeat protein